MKIKSLILAMAACAGLFSACSNDLEDATSGNGNTTDGKKDAYASVSFIMPSAAGTRANPAGGQAGDGPEVGTDNENKFKTVSVLLFKDGVLLTESKELAFSDFTATTVDNKIVYTTEKDLNVASGIYKVYVVLNPIAEHFIVEENSTTLTAFQEMVENATKGKGEYCIDGQFMMTNADPIENTEILPTNTEGKAKSITVNVERIAAKISFTQKMAAYEFTDSYGNALSVAFDAFKVINTRNSAYNLRRVGMDAFNVNIGGNETDKNYVIENKWNEKSVWSGSVFESNYSRRATDTYVAFRKLTATNETSQTLAYCLENTMLKDMQIKGYTTAIIFRAKATVEGITTTTGDLYKYQGGFYANLIKVAQSADAEWDGTDNEEALKNLRHDILNIKAGTAAMPEGQKTVTAYLATINNPATLNKTFGVDYFVGGYCYYEYQLRHANNDDNKTMGIMEFAIVRNNVYKVTINSVAAMGSISSGTKGQPDPTDPAKGEEDNDPSNPNPEMPGTVVPTPEPTDPIVEIIPTDPDESNDTYLNVTIDILPWIVRNNDIDFE